MTPSSASPSNPDDGCGPAALSLSELFTDETGDRSFCFDGATPSLAIENERDETLTVTVDVETDGAITETYTLESGERVVERNAFEAKARLTGTVTVDGEGEQSIEWPERSCYRHGIALTPDGIEIGRIEPLSGPGDTQHDCYPGDGVPLRVRSADARTVTVEITDLCTGTNVTETLEPNADETARLDDVLANGGTYTVAVDVEGGQSRTHEFREDCWGVSVAVDGDGTVRVDGIAID